MPQNIFSRLIKYRPTELVTPRENFLTEAFAAVIENDSEFAIELRRQIQRVFGITEIVEENISDVQTQVYLSPNLRIDMVIWLSQDLNSRVGIEIKWGTGQREHQLSDYKQHLEKVIYLTEPGANPPEIKIPHWTWDKINSLIVKLNKNRDKSSWISTQFSNWLKEEGMAEQHFKLMDLAMIPFSWIVDSKVYGCMNLFKSEVDKMPIWKNLGLRWTESSPNTRFTRYQTYVYISNAQKLGIFVAIAKEEDDQIVAQIWIESNPKCVNERSLIKKYLRDKLKQIKDSEFSVIEDEGWWIMYASKPLTRFFEETNELPFEKITQWWADRLNVIVDNKIIEDLRKICV
jgi:hypothetical protein